jgi:hypothetical protein
MLADIFPTGWHATRLYTVRSWRCDRWRLFSVRNG